MIASCLERLFMISSLVSMTSNVFLLLVMTEFLSYVILDHSKYSSGLYGLENKLVVSKI